MKKGCLIAAALGLGFIGLILVIALLATGGVVEGADKFLALVGQGKLKEAYESTSDGFRQDATYAVFEKFVKRSGLDGFQSSFWNNRQMENDAGKVEGTATLKDGRKIELTVHMLKSGGAWRVHHLEAPLGAPSEAEAKEMALATLLSWNDAVQAGDFTKFHADCAKAFREQVSAEKLLEVFRVFREKQVDVAGIKNVQPTFDTPPAKNEQGVFVLEGKFPTTPVKVQFNLKYAPEGGDWKCLGINVQLVD